MHNFCYEYFASFSLFTAANEKFQVAPEAEFRIYKRSLSRVCHTKRRLFAHRKCFIDVGRKSEKGPGQKNEMATITPTRFSRHWQPVSLRAA